MSIFLCPICKQKLNSDGHSLRCASKHTFDIAAAGYVNLLRNESKHCAVPGDSKDMCASRNHFLSKDYYRCLADGLSALIADACPQQSPVLVDAACGEGYYTTAFWNAMTQCGKTPVVAGVDISKYALKYAGKRCKGAEFATASIFELPLESGCADVLTNIFAPVALDEFRRVLRPGGKMVIVGPGERHLWELKEFLYDTPYLNEPKHYSFEGFEQEDPLRVDSRILLGSGEDIMNLFVMTPYCWKTSPQATRRLEQLTSLEVTISFEAHVFRRLAP